jgi:glycerophosphoryl diester phosphodiesterase
MQVVGHRGAKGLAPENTMLAIEKAIEYKVSIVEVDVRVTKDGVPILFHNRKLKINHEPPLVIAKTDYAHLKHYKDDLTTLEQAIAVTAHKTRLCMEIKRGVELAHIIKLVSAQLDRGESPVDFMFSSFSYASLKQLKAILPQVGVAVNESWSGVRAGYRCRKLQGEYICLNYRFLWRGYLKLASRGGQHIYGFTINEPKIANRLSKHGLAGVITDYPDRFLN